MLSQSLITIQSLPPLAGLDASHEDLAAMGAALAKSSRSFDNLLRSDGLAAALGALPEADRQTVIAAYTAAGGDMRTLSDAIALLAKAQADQDGGGVRLAWYALGALSVGASLFHGYRRNDSIGWGLWWGFMGGIFPVVTPAIALAQGFGKPKR
jgi:hypothetical protein